MKDEFIEVILHNNLFNELYKSMVDSVDEELHNKKMKLLLNKLYDSIDVDIELLHQPYYEIHEDEVVFLKVLYLYRDGIPLDDFIDSIVQEFKHEIKGKNKLYIYQIILKDNYDKLLIKYY